MIHAEADRAWRVRERRLWIVFSGYGDDSNPAGGPGGRGFHRAPGAPFLFAGVAWCWSGGLRQGADPVPGGHDVSGPGPGGLDPQAPLSAAAGQAGGGVQTSDAVKVSSCLRKFRDGRGEGSVLVVVLSGGQAVVQAAEEAAEQVALGGGVPVSGVAAAVVVGAGAG